MNDRAAGLVIAVFGVATASYASRFPAIQGQSVGPSVFPTVIALGLAACGVLLTIGRPGPATRTPPPWRERPRLLVDVAAVVGSLIFFAAALETLGFLLTAFVSLAGLLLAFGAGWRWTLPLALLVTLTIHYAFYTLLRVPLPWGVLSGRAW